MTLVRPLVWGSIAFSEAVLANVLYEASYPKLALVCVGACFTSLGIAIHRPQ